MVISRIDLRRSEEATYFSLVDQFLVPLLASDRSILAALNRSTTIG